jgi:DNA-binding response OmpR family regulator
MKLPFARALIVDDEQQSQMRVQFALEHVGFQCDLAADGLEAMYLATNNRYHVIVSELVLPNAIAGELVLKSCGQDYRPVVIVHTRVLEQDVYRGLKEQGVDAIFYKPADYSAMARNIQGIVEGHLSPQGRRWKHWREGSTAGQNEVVQILRRGDGWIQDSSVRVEAFRFSIVVLACVLFGMGWGNSLNSSMAGVCKMFGLCGFAFYFCLELVAYNRSQLRQKLVRWSAERRLDEQMESHTPPESVPAAKPTAAECLVKTAQSLLASESNMVTAGYSRGADTVHSD